MRRQDARRVSFDILDTSQAVVDKPAARNSRKQKRDKRAALYKTFMIESSCIHTNSENKRIQFSSVDQMENLCIFSVKRAELHTTPVNVYDCTDSDFVRRNDELWVLEEFLIDFLKTFVRKCIF